MSSPEMQSRYHEEKLTDYEVDALPSIFNFADGHARYTLPYDPNFFWKQIPALFSRSLQQYDIEAEFSQTFFDFAQQRRTVCAPHALYCPSASVCIEIIANFLRNHDIATALIEPTFDNLADILKRHRIAMTALREDHLRAVGIQEWLKDVDASAIFIVFPNNPTGYTFSETDFHYLVNFCAKNQKLLILDFSFRFFAPELLKWDQYEVLEAAGVRYIAIEDTGKTWPTAELKVGLLLADKHTSIELLSIYRDIFLCLSPVILWLMNEHIKMCKQLGREHTILHIPHTNRALLRKTLAQTALHPLYNSSLSVEWLRIDADLIDDLKITRELKMHGIYVLPGRNFFWNNQKSATQFIRFSLMRDIDMFDMGMQRLASLLPSILDQDT